MIPDGFIEYHGGGGKPLPIRLPETAREPEILFQAVFRSGTCAIMVWPKYVGGVLSPPPNAASLMYFKVLPAVRRTAQKMADMCLPETRTGFDVGEAATEEFWEQRGTVTFAYMLSLQGAKPQRVGVKLRYRYFEIP